jgi:hypothetical protein
VGLVFNFYCTAGQSRSWCNDLEPEGLMPDPRLVCPSAIVGFLVIPIVTLVGSQTFRPEGLSLVLRPLGGDKSRYPFEQNYQKNSNNECRV